MKQNKLQTLSLSYLNDYRKKNFFSKTQLAQKTYTRNLLNVKVLFMWGRSRAHRHQCRGIRPWFDNYRSAMLWRQTLYHKND